MGPFERRGKMRPPPPPPSPPPTPTLSPLNEREVFSLGRVSGTGSRRTYTHAYVRSVGRGLGASPSSSSSSSPALSILSLFIPTPTPSSSFSFSFCCTLFNVRILRIRTYALLHPSSSPFSPFLPPPPTPSRRPRQTNRLGASTACSEWRSNGGPGGANEESVLGAAAQLFEGGKWRT